MTRVTVTIDTKSNARLFLDLLAKLNFVKKVETEALYDELSDQEISMLEERWSDYLKNPQKGKTWSEVKAAIKKKHAKK